MKKKEIEKKYYVTDNKQFPEISRFDPVAFKLLDYDKSTS